VLLDADRGFQYIAAPAKVERVDPSDVRDPTGAMMIAMSISLPRTAPANAAAAGSVRLPAFHEHRLAGAVRLAQPIGFEWLCNPGYAPGTGSAGATAM
jgi:hypothetical protein